MRRESRGGQACCYCPVERSFSHSSHFTSVKETPLPIALEAEGPKGQFLPSSTKRNCTSAGNQTTVLYRIGIFLNKGIILAPAH
jgi:hypothetical protein